MTKKRGGKLAARAPARRKSKVKSRRKVSIKPLLRRGWWMLRGAAAGLVVVAIVFAAWKGAGAAVKMPSLSVKSISVTGCSDNLARALVEMSGVHKGDPLLRVDLEAVRRKIQRHSAVRDVVVVRHLPGTLSIEVRERNGVAVVTGKGRFALVDAEGVVISESDRYPEGYPLVTGTAQAIAPGKVVSEALPVLRAVTALSGSGLMGSDRISEAWSSGGAVYVSLVKSGTLLVMNSVEPGADIGRLARLMRSSLFDVQAPGYDLRFEGRVVRLPERKGKGA